MGRRKNPAELVLMGANPLRGAKPKRGESALDYHKRLLAMTRQKNPSHHPYDSLSREEKLAFGRLGLGKAKLATEHAIEQARKKVQELGRFRNRLPNPSSAAAESAREMYESFHDAPSEFFTVMNEPHMPAGDYADLGKLIALRVKPVLNGPVQEITFPGKSIRVVSEDRRQIWFVGNGQDISDEELQIFTQDLAEPGRRVHLGECRSIVYEAAKWHQAVPDTVRGTKVEWEHAFGEDGGSPPNIWLETFPGGKQRIELSGGTYHVEGVGIVN